MGYRSEVAFVVPDSAPRFEDIENRGWLTVISESDGFRLYHATWVKWYSDFPVVKAVLEYFANLDTEEGGNENYLFIRLGEDNSDVEEEGGLWDNPFDLGWARKIEFNK